MNFQSGVNNPRSAVLGVGIGKELAVSGWKSIPPTEGACCESLLGEEPLATEGSRMR